MDSKREGNNRNFKQRLRLDDTKNSVKSYILKQPDITITKLGTCFMALFIKPGFHVGKIPDDQEFVVSQQF